MIVSERRITAAIEEPEALMTADNSGLSRGLLFGILSFIIWGISPMYWKLLADTNIFTLVAHRML